MARRAMDEEELERWRAQKRWRAMVYYRTNNGVVSVQHDIEELGEIEELIERGPNWYTIERIEIVLSDDTDPLTIEEAAVL
jgi:hypothetical protein